MSEVKKYYYLKLKDNFFDSQEVRILESMQNGIYYSNMLIKLYLNALKHEGALKLNDYKSFDENMIAALTNLDIEIVRSGLEALASLNLIEKLEDGTIYMSNMQSFIGKSNNEADRKRLYREKIEGEKQQQNQTKGKEQEETLASSDPTDGTILDKRPPEIRDKENRDLEFRVIKNKYKETETKSKKNKDKKDVDSLSVHLLKDFERRTGNIGSLNLGALKKAVHLHGADNVQMAIDKALEKNKPTMIYINGILKNWAKEGYPKEVEYNGYGGAGKNTGTGAGEFAGFKPKEPKSISEEERKLLEAQLL